MVSLNFFYWHNPPGRTMALGSTRPLTEMSTRNVSWGKGGRCWQPYHLHMPIVLISGSLKLLEPSGPVQACNGIALPLPLLLRCKTSINPRPKFSWQWTSLILFVFHLCGSFCLTL